MKKSIMIQGTGSGVGKSVIVSALCRIFLQDGYSVAPFKAQNMALNSFVTKEGAEIGRAQAAQAAACKLEPSADMNPILLKPSAERKAQVILRGKPIGNMSAIEYHSYKRIAKKTALESFGRLRRKYEAIVIEGAGSPAEINLKAQDIVNMEMARCANAPVVLVGDIDRGGVFAWIVGTLELLTDKEKKRIKGIIINKFRGDKRLLSSGIRFLEKRAGIKVLGIIPYFKDISMPEEDSVSLEHNTPYAIRRTQYDKPIEISIIKLPHISNFTDFDCLSNEPGVNVEYIDDKSQLNSPDVIILPGTKNTIEDLAWLRRSGLAEKILSAIDYRPSTVLIGICGGYQMLGRKIYDLSKIESNKKEIDGLGILPIVTHFSKEKTLSQIRAKALDSMQEVYGYEIHHGRTKNIEGAKPAFKITERYGKPVEDFDGGCSQDGRIWGTYIHGVFDADDFRGSFLNRLRRKKGQPVLSCGARFNLDKEFDKLAELVRSNVDMKRVYKILNNEL